MLKKNVHFWNTHSNSVNFQPTDFVQISMELSWKYDFNGVNKLFLRWLVQKLLRDMLETLEVWKWQLLYRVFHLNFHFLTSNSDTVNIILSIWKFIQFLYMLLAASPLASSGFVAIGDWKVPFQTSMYTIFWWLLY